MRRIWRENFAGGAWASNISCERIAGWKSAYEEYKKMTDKQHLSKARTMPINFLKRSGKGFFVEKEGYAIAVRDELRDIVGNVAFREHMGDVLKYRVMEYYRRRHVER